MTTQKSIEYDLLGINGEKLNSKHTLALNILENSGNYLIHKDILRHNQLQRQSTSSTKTRSEVRGGGRKPWKQKGTGRARAGSNRSPLWKGGGTIFGPKPRTLTHKLNKKERRLALRTLLYNKKDSMLVLDDLEKSLQTHKTKGFLQICSNCQIDLNQKLLVVVSKKTNFLKFATKNVRNVELISALQLNSFSLIKAQQLILTRSAMKNIEETFCG